MKRYVLVLEIEADDVLDAQDRADYVMDQRIAAVLHLNAKLVDHQWCPGAQIKKKGNELLVVGEQLELTVVDL
jgi:hypothetical protein